MNILTFGNKKLPRTTAVLNMCAATDCPARALGLCSNAAICYAKRAEDTYGRPHALRHRREQAKFWRESSASEIASALLALQARRRTPLLALRLNESGDFRDADDIAKAELVARLLQESYPNIVTYCYTARRDLKFPDKPYFRVMGSGFMIHGQYNVVRKGQPIPRVNRKNVLCPGDCRICDVCLDPQGRTVWAKEH